MNRYRFGLDFENQPDPTIDHAINIHADMPLVVDADLVRSELALHLDEEEMREKSGEFEKGEGGQVGDELMWRLFQVGEWITWKMKQHGATEQETKDQSFVIGQQSWPNRDPFAIAAQVFNDWMEGRAGQPGRELGDRILDEVLE